MLIIGLINVGLGHSVIFIIKEWFLGVKKHPISRPIRHGIWEFNMFRCTVSLGWFFFLCNFLEFLIENLSFSVWWFFKGVIAVTVYFKNWKICWKWTSSNSFKGVFSFFRINFTGIYYRVKKKSTPWIIFSFFFEQFLTFN